MGLHSLLMAEFVYVVQYRYDYRKDAEAYIVSINRSFAGAWNAVLLDCREWDEEFDEDLSYEWVDYPSLDYNSLLNAPGPYGWSNDQEVVNGLIVGEFDKSVTRQIKSGSAYHLWTISRESIKE